MNRSLHLAIALSVAGVFGLAHAQSATPRQPPADIPPPPGLDDPGVGTAAAPAQDEAAPATRAAGEDALAPLPRPDSRLVRDKASREAASDRERIAASEVTSRQQGTDTVEEYRQNGRLWMVRIRPASGPEQTFYATDPSGRLVRDPNMGPVAPVYYTLYEWK
ncbi:MAG: DUF2782 domain-containing protein [Xanthomonadales bacterium]|nr:DUF2782 domain-containing protein [Xanthomonadales bacterium]